jgi:uncharacterized phage protein gp47/JayE
MLFKKNYGELVQDALSFLATNTDITNTNAGGITRALVEIINKNISEYYDVLDINMAMGFLSTSEGYFLDLIGTLFNMDRIRSTAASVSVAEGAQKFYVADGTLHDRIPTDVIPAGTTVSDSTGTIVYSVSSDTVFDVGATEVYVPITSQNTGSQYNVGVGVLTVHDLGVDGVFTTNVKAIVSGTDTESDENFRYRISNATLTAERANETAIRLACLSVDGVADLLIKPYARGIGTFDVIVIPIEGIATQSLLDKVQEKIDTYQALGMRGTAIAPSIVPVDIEVKLVFVNNTTDYEKTTIRMNAKTAIESYIVNIPIGGTFIVNEMRQQIMDVSSKIKDHVISCYYFREQPCFHKNIEIYWDEMFYPNPDSDEAIRVI